VSVSIRIIRAFRAMLSQESDEIYPAWGTSREVNPPWTEASIDAEYDALQKACPPLLGYKRVHLARRVHSDRNQIRPEFVSNGC
jgi:hypothetical protein